MRFTSSRWGEIAGAAALIGVGAYVAFKAPEYSIGQLSRMGSGYFPLALGIILMGLGVGIIFETRKAVVPLPRLPLRPLLAISFGIVAFGLFVGRLGLVPATFILVALVAFAQDRYRPIQTAIVAISVSVLGYLIFLWGLGLPMRAFWWT